VKILHFDKNQREAFRKLKEAHINEIEPIRDSIRLFIDQNHDLIKTDKLDENVLIASFSVMPDRDNVNVLYKYAAENQIIDNKWQLLTGDKKEIYQLARKGYFADENVGVQKGENDFFAFRKFHFSR
jgi:vacuolar-type H+-ATPase subunit C/Vma6